MYQAEATTRVGGQDRRSARAGHPLPLWYSLLVAAAVIAATAYGLLVGDAYRVTPKQEAIWRGQDLVTLVAVALLVWSAVRAHAGSFRAHMLWLGLLFWLTYGYAHLAFGAPYNDAFLLYVAVLGLAGYALLDGLLRIDVAAVAPAFADTPRRTVAWFMVVGGAGIAGLWLSELLAAFPGGKPVSILVYDLPSPTYVLDLAWVIPMALASARLLWRQHPAGPVIATVTLIMLLLLSVAMLALTPFWLGEGLAFDVPFGVVFSVLFVVEAILLGRGAARLHATRRPWLRPSLWADAGPGK
jgi:hypothetical protein